MTQIVSNDKTLADLGEREIVRRILPKYCHGIGDDCALVTLDGHSICVTTDPVPEPAAKVIGNDPDMFWMGWLLVTINASDLAAAGAHPLAFVTSIEAPSNLLVSEFERLLEGIREGCVSEGLPYVGGNLKEAKALSAVGTAIGTSEPQCLLTRRGARPGDLVVSVGAGGIFWRDALRLRNLSISPVKETSPVFKPHSQVRAMEQLNRAGLIAAAIDNSDGLLPTLVQLAETNSIGIRLDLDKLTVPMENVSLEIDPARLWLGWGDWNVIAGVNSSQFERLRAAAATLGTSVHHIGEFIQGSPTVVLKRGIQVQQAPRLESERFARDSWFSEGIEGYVHRLLNLQIPGQPDGIAAGDLK
jgi:thiamine-monophosphate kinase